ncbi:MAG: tRNA (guanosine(46)-N7)-methyltransferase TrmB, partial [Bacteroidales bacterium]|nr:tRNA (guanosine(46)-N7)-methyltransferase TrmB [Bacteroidales bacterium]
ARLWKGAKEATEENMGNVAFLRTRIEFIDAFFGPGEVSEIWLTFSDPQLRGSENARLTSPLFLQRYHRFLKPRGIVHLKTDSRFLYEYTQSVIRANGLEVLASGVDIYNAPLVIPSEAEGGVEKSLPDLPAVFEVQTFYESMFLKMGLPITYVAFRLEHEGEKFAYPTDFDAEYWREAEGPRRSFSHQPTKG